MVFLLLGTISVNLLPSIYHLVEESFMLDGITPILIVEAGFILIAAIFAVIWGYFIDKVNRKIVLIVAAMCMFIGFGLSASTTKFLWFTVGRGLTAIGFGAQIPAIYSIMADLIPAKHWSKTFASIALFVGMSNFFGNFISGFLTPFDIWGFSWQISFVFLTIGSFFCGIALFFIIIPNRGASSIRLVDKELGEELRRGEVGYHFTIKKSDISVIWNSKINRWIVLQAFFYVIPGATMASFLIYYFIDSPFQSFPPLIQIQIAGIFAAAVGVGYILGTLILGPIFDKIHAKDPARRARLSYLALAVAMPLIMVAFICIVPVEYSVLNLPDFNDVAAILDVQTYIVIVGAILTHHPVYGLYFILLFVGGFFAAPISINRTPTLLEINLPEHSASTQALLNFSDQFGKGLTFLIIAFQYVVYDILFHSFFDGKFILIASVFWYIIPILCWRKISQMISPEIEKKNVVMQERANTLRALNELLKYQ